MLQFCAAAPHLGIIIGTITYVCIGATVFLYIEQPNEIASREVRLAAYEKIKYVSDFSNFCEFFLKRIFQIFLGVQFLIIVGYSFLFFVFFVTVKNRLYPFT